MKKSAKSKNRPAIPNKVQILLWMKTGGRCQFDGCNKALWRNELTMNDMNASYIAHIYAYSANGPRYDAILSPKLEKDFSNLMLVCDVCHRTFDDMGNVSEYPASKLIAMKKDHEDRIELLTSIKKDKRSHIILFGSKIGNHDSPLHIAQATQAIIPKFYPASANAVELGLKNSSFIDGDDTYWKIESENLVNLFQQRMENIKTNHDIQHYSIFALAPQPLLIKLGTLLNDLYSAEVYQLHREPKTWAWQSETSNIDYKIIESSTNNKKVALNLSLSATITNDRIISTLGSDTSIWSMTIDRPENNFLKGKKDLEKFRTSLRNLFNSIKAKHGEDAELHIFPAIPVAAAVELGRVWMPKADLPFTIYDQNRTMGGFIKTIDIK